ncbi:MAG: SAM-dependent methyltransferase [Bacteroidales bacterium]|nr:SAM-dependent methyltransferase [Bacteroidales bacterium]
MTRAEFFRHLQQRDYRTLFVSQMGWNRPSGNTVLPIITLDERSYEYKIVAHRESFLVLHAEVDELPTASMGRRLDAKLRPSATTGYLAIYSLKGNPSHQLWLVPVKNVDRRDLVAVEYDSEDKTDFLFSKIEELTFGFDERLTNVDVNQRVHHAFALNSERVTKSFYDGFRKQHKAFTALITGINDAVAAKDNRQKQWYASVMLNRLMFCYFIQKKGFLDGNPNYLRDQLAKCQEERGVDRFYQTFYRSFLRHLFSDGLNSPRHDRDFERKYGQIPYLNGGMFDTHPLEQEFPDIDIADEAFDQLFEFFDRWRWHLDTRIEASGRDINPDVIGYIFEQYINDRAEMGAYYTKEDITEYISRSTILPFIFDKVKRTSQSMGRLFEPDGWVWQQFSQSGERYIFDAVKKGYTPTWREEIPENIAIGLDTSTPGLLERRKDWNTRTPERWALPTEIWRETIERLQRCDDILQKILSGEIHEINDFITYNLDIRQFASDIVNHPEAPLSLIFNFYDALRSVTILDPTCGSGAFLFAAMNILEPLYYDCITRLQESRSQMPAVKKALEEITAKYRSNIHYFIYKSIILRNLYGVDIMAEATEIAKLRLFLKMVAVVDVDYYAPNIGLDPLPDIDFNIRCGNTLVGYANAAEIERDLSNNGGNWEVMLANDELKEKIRLEMEKVAQAYKIFRQAQLSDYTDNLDEFKQAKRELDQRLHALNQILNLRLYAATRDTSNDQDLNLLLTTPEYKQWETSHQPFHWIAEYYSIIAGNGGFDVIIGNPPYVEYKPSKSSYKVRTANTKTNLYALCLIRTTYLIGNLSSLGMIVLLSLTSTPRMNGILAIINQEFQTKYYSHYEGTSNPGILFEGVKAQLCIVLARKQGVPETKTTHYNRFYSVERPFLFSKIKYIHNHETGKIAKTSDPLLFKIVKKIPPLKQELSNNVPLYYRNMGNFFWKIATDVPPLYEKAGKIEESKTVSQITYHDIFTRDFYICLYNSTLFFMIWNAYSDCYHLNVSNFNIGEPLDFHKEIWEKLRSKLLSSYYRNGYIQTENRKDGICRYFRFFPSKSKAIIDEIDKVLAKHYGFTEEELDFIINYDIKYRMGDELNADEEND